MSRSERLRKEFLKAADHYADGVAAAVEAGHVSEEDCLAMGFDTVVRSYERIKLLPDDRDLEGNEIEQFQAAILGIFCGALFVMENGDFPPAHVAIVGTYDKKVEH